MTDIFFVSNNEPNAEANWERLKSLFPLAKRVNGIKGIHEAHKTCAAMAETDRFVVIDADNWVVDGFDPTPPDSPPHPDAVYVWRSRNPLNGLVYGHGAIKSFPTKLVSDMPRDSVDMTTSTSMHYRIVKTIGSEHRFNTTAFETWRTAFRECTKLSSGIIHRQKSGETYDRLTTWCSVAEGEYAEWCIKGAQVGRLYGEVNRDNVDALRKINDFNWIRQCFEALERGENLMKKFNGEVDLVSILIGFEQLMPDRQEIRDVRLYLQDPPKDPEKSFPLFRVAERVIEDSPLLTALRGLSIDQSPKRVFKVLEESGEPDDLLRYAGKSIEQYTNVNWTDALSKGQIQSKMWLVKTLRELNFDLGTVFLVGGWLGVLPALMIRDGSLKFKKIRSFDLDPACAPAAESLNQGSVENGWLFKATTADMLQINYKRYYYDTLLPDGSPNPLAEKPDTIINTSCDHIAPFRNWWSLIPKGRLVILQNNDFFQADEDHVNNVKSLEQMKAQAPLREIYYEGVLELQKYKRFMLIGRR